MYDVATVLVEWLRKLSFGKAAICVYSLVVAATYFTMIKL